MRFFRRPLIAAFYAALLFPLYGQAQLLNYSHTNARGTEANAGPSRAYLNLGGSITLNLISSLDRYERVTPKLVTVDDRITAADDSEFYGKSMELPVLGEGNFPFKSETLNNKSNALATTNSSFNIYDLDALSHNPFVGFGLFVFFTSLYLCIRGFLDERKDKSAKKHAVQPSQSLPAYASADHAAAVHSFANQEFFQLLLGVMRKNLAAEGYVPTQDQHQRIPLAPESFRRVAKAVFMAREQHLAPGQPSHIIMERANNAMESGFALHWLETLIHGSESTGWFIAPGAKKPLDASENLTDWQKNAYPLRQVTVKIFATQRWQLTRDMVSCLSEIAALVREQSFPEDEDGIQFTGNSLTSDIQYSIQWRISFQPPGFFPDAAGTHIPSSLHVDDSFSVGSPEHELTLFVQGTRHTSPGYLADYMDMAGKRIKEGEIRGAHYDDDSGYAFFVNNRFTSRASGIPFESSESPTLDGMDKVKEIPAVQTGNGRKEKN